MDQRVSLNCLQFPLICHPDVDPPPMWVHMVLYTKHSGPWTDQDRTNALEAQKQMSTR